MDNFGYYDPNKRPSQRRSRFMRNISTISRPRPPEELPLNENENYRKPRSYDRLQWSVSSNKEERLDINHEHVEYVSVGETPPAESVPNMYRIFDESVTEVNVPISNDSIRSDVREHMHICGGQIRYLDEIEAGIVNVDSLVKAFSSASEAEKNISLLWAAFLKRDDLLPLFTSVGADIFYSEVNGLSAIHFSAYSASTRGVLYFLSIGVDPDFSPRRYAPLHCASYGHSTEVIDLLLSYGASLNVNRSTWIEDPIHSAVRANATHCVKLLISHGAEVNSIEPGGVNAIHLAAELGHVQCLAALLDTNGADVNIKTKVHDKESTALHFAADGGFIECVDLLLDNDADVNIKNHRGFTPLHLASRSSRLDCVEALLRNGKSNPNAEDYDKRTPLHAAVGKANSACDVIELLLTYGANVNHKDEYGYSPLHLAALDGRSNCVETLIYKGADITTKSKKGNSALEVITRKMPSSLAMISQKLDSSIRLLNTNCNNGEIELELDFRVILQHCYPREIRFLNVFVDEGQKEILLHPLCSAFLYVKWEKIRKYYIARLVFYFIFVVFLSIYILTVLVHNCNKGKDNTNSNKTIMSSSNSSAEYNERVDVELCQKQSILGQILRLHSAFMIDIQWWFLASITFFEIFRKIYGIPGYSTFKQYFRQLENVMEWFVIVSVFLIAYINSIKGWQNHVGAFAALAGWCNLMLMVGQLPVFGNYVAMYQKVQKEFTKLFMAYSCILIGFTISFCVIFPESSSFSNPFMGFITVITMMIGELNISILENDPYGKDPPLYLEISAQIVFVLFLVFVTIILLNLLVGIAVHDIQGLRNSAGLLKLVRQTKLISYMEEAIFNEYIPTCLKKILHRTALVSPTAFRVVLNVRPLNPGEKRLPRDIMMAACEIAKARKKDGHTIAIDGSRSPYFSFKKYENFGESGSYSQHENTNMAIVQKKLDETTDTVKHLAREVYDLKDMISKQQTLLLNFTTSGK